MIDMSSTAFSRYLRARAAASRSPLPDHAVSPLAARPAGASGDPEPLSPGSPSLPRGSAVEAGRSAMQSDPGDECGCPACQSDCAGIAPCQRDNER
jgi:hypothetical protein